MMFYDTNILLYENSNSLNNLDFFYISNITIE